MRGGGRPSPEFGQDHPGAQRVARLLISEILLYDGEKVERGLAESDLYAHLESEIKMARKMYEKRYPPQVRAYIEIFDKELVEMLANGDWSKFGEHPWELLH